MVNIIEPEVQNHIIKALELKRTNAYTQVDNEISILSMT